MRPEKQSIAAELKARTEGADYIILTDFRGIKVAQTEELRERLRGVSARYNVVPNRIYRHVIKDVGLDGLEEGLKGPSAMVYGSGDVVEAAKALQEFVQKNQTPKIKMGMLGRRALSAEDVGELAKLPARPVMLAMAVGAIAAPLSSLVGVLQQKVASLVYVLKAVEEKKQQA